jgi:DEAD/DEAH box helicase domain-containing protein
MDPIEVSVALRDFFANNQWTVVDVLETAPRAAELLPVDDLPLSLAGHVFLDRLYPAGIYRHQKEALRWALGDSASGKPAENVCLVTGTASGKSLVFQAAAINLLANDPQARVMAIYPMKALGNEQRERWHTAMVNAGLAELENEALVGRIDGNVPPGFRLNILERSRVVVFTPDIIHAWLFSNLSQPAVIDFLRQVRLIVVDEVHAYSGVFGSNAAFLFRRLQHLLALLGARPAYIAASATIAHPLQHLRSLFGQPFRLIGPDEDTSPRFPLEVYLADPPGSERFLDSVVRMLEFLTHQVSARFIAFVDSRKQVELISSILNRLLRESKEAAAAAAAAAAVEGEQPSDEGGTPPRKNPRARRAPAQPAAEPEEPDPEGEVTGVLQHLNVLPYRAGYEDHDRRQIQERLTEGTLNGVVSTSALELGIDVPNLDVCVLIGVPSSATSLQQRIGRIGRHSPGVVIVVNGGDVHDSTVFAHPRTFFERPLAESALYLENEHIQYIHALCLARPGGEHDQVEEAALKLGLRRKLAGTTSFPGLVEWPLNFLALANRERRGEAPRHLVSLKLEARERPNYTFPLRDVESQFKVERRDGPNVTSMGSLSFSQLMREAYPGAIYYYATIPYRVTRVNVKAKVVQVRREKRYTTQPQRTLPAVFPRLSPGGIFAAGRQGSLLSLETSLLVRESIRGVVEQRGRNESLYPYPLSRELGFSQDQPYFSRNYFTTGVALTHPALAGDGVNLELAAAMLYEAFLLKFPFERQDIGFAADRFRVTRSGLIAVDQPFLAIYDQTYGSLRLSSRLLDPSVMVQVLSGAAFLAGAQESLSQSPATLRALAALAQTAIHEPREPLGFGAEAAAQRDLDRWDRVVLPGSKGLMVRTNEEFHVLRILKTPAGLSYEGTPTSMLGSSASLMPLLTDVAEIPGESEMGWYDVENGVIEPAEQSDAAVFGPLGRETPAAAIDPAWLSGLLATYLDEESLTQLARQQSVDAGGDRDQRIDRLSTRCPAEDLLDAALSVYIGRIAGPA